MTFQKGLLIALSSSLLMAALTGCSLNAATNQPSHVTNQPTNQSTGQSTNRVINQSAGSSTNQPANQSAGQSATEATNQSSQSSNSTVNNDAAKITIPQQKKLSYLIEGETDTRNATAYISSNQPFYMYVMSGFKASAEEPGKDIIMPSPSQQDAFLRVEVLQPGVSTQQLAQQAKGILQSVSSKVVAVPSKDLPSDTFFKNAKSWYANGSKITAFIYVVNVNGTPVRFTIHVPREWESSIQFVTMMENFHLLHPGQKVTVN